MQQQPDKKTVEEALKLANSPAGQKLIAMMKSSNSDTVDKVRQHAESGDLEQAKTALSQMLQSEEIKELLREMRKHNE